MKMYLISDNVDTQMGLRLVGIEGVVVHDKDKMKQELTKCISDKEIGIVLMTSKVFDLDRPFLLDFKLNTPEPLLVEISDRHKSHEVQSMIDETISKIVGGMV